MRRVATFIVALGLTIIGIAGSTASRPGAGPPGVAVARLAARVTQGGTPVKAVRFGGYMIDVPATWPVYWLDSNPTTCVRFDRNAVYLGRPGPDQVCPAHLVGRAATISLQVPPAAGGPAMGGPAAGTGQSPSALPAVGNLPRVGGPVHADPQDHELYATVQHPGLSISATYSGAASPILKIIQSVARASTQSAAAGQPPAQPITRAAGQPAAWPAGQAAAQSAGQRAVARPPAVTAAISGVPLSDIRAGGTTRARLMAGAGHANSAAAHVVGKGFDACTAPSLAVMQAWQHAFSYAGIYIGGVEAGCGYGNLSADWIRSVTALGWGLIPAYVGPQAPCDTQFTVRIDRGRAAAEGRAAAADAVQHAAAFGLGPGTPIYYDIESFDTGNTSCRLTVLSFLDAWTRQIHASGYVSGVYSSASTGAAALGLATTVYGRPLAKPDSMWFALWDGQSNVIGTPYLDVSWWPGYHRIKQYLGGHNRRVNGFTVNIDSDLVRGPVYR
jgi:hypothetical protein